MLAIFALISSKITWSIFTAIQKDLRRKGVSTFSSLSISIFAVPVLSLLGLVAAQQYGFIFSWQYILIVTLWVIPVYLSNFLDVYLLKHQSLVEQNSYKLAIKTGLALFVDVVVFSTNFNLKTLSAIALFFFGGILLSKNRAEVSKSVSRRMALLIIAAIALLDIADFTIYKIGLLMQPSLFFHIFISQSLLFLLIFFTGYKKLFVDIHSGVISKKYIVSFTVLIVLYLLLQAVVVKNLPIAIFISASILPIIIYSLFDLRNKEIRLSRQTILALILVCAGIAVLII